MVRRWIIVALVVLLAGCSSTPRTTTPPAPQTFTATATLSDLQPSARTTDTMYLLDAPHMQAAFPQDKVLRTHVPSVFEALAGHSAPTVSWVLPRDGLNVLEGNASVWVDVEGPVTNPNVPASNGQACFWNVVLGIKQSDGGSTSYGDCLDEPTVVPSGVRELKFHFPAFDANNVAGDLVFIGLGSSGIYGDGATVDVLSGSPDFPSHLSLHGLALTLDTQTYL